MSAIAFGGEKGALSLCQPDSLFFSKRNEGHDLAVTCITAAPNGSLLATASQDCSIKIWDASTLKLLFTLRAHTGIVKSISISGDSKRLVSGGFDSKISVFRLLDGYELFSWCFDDDE